MSLQIRWLSDQPDFETIWQAMRDYTNVRTADSPDEVWLLEHPPVYTLGQAGKPEHILNPQSIPVVKTDRGGQVTYHGPGQLIAYCLIDLRRQGLYVREYVARLEDAIIATLAHFDLPSQRKDNAPGVYVQGRQVLNNLYQPDELVKIAALGVKIRNGRSYHGLSLNVDMDLSPFAGINPCGYAGLGTTDMRSCGQSLTLSQVGQVLSLQLKHQFSAQTENVYE
ncbi:MAG TPA: lipoyl(octanoyl) transferase LipB [Alcaligenaceae bacterium]|nr:lipoyl(octanoyl) transferase LipB [Alcaligenaceae bacterium]